MTNSLQEQAIRCDADRILGSMGASLDGLRHATVLMTGGTGFLGSWLLAVIGQGNATRNWGCEVAVLTRDARSFAANRGWLGQSPWITVIEGDITRCPIPSGRRFTHLVHGAADPFPATDPKRRWQLAHDIIAGTNRIIEVAAACGVQRFLQISSGAVYGPAPQGLLDESCASAPDPLNATCAYHLAKRSAESQVVLGGAAWGFTATIARCFSFYGPWQRLDGHFAMSQFLASALQGAPLNIAGDGRAMRSFMYAADAAGWLLAALLHGGHARAYHVGGSQAISIADLAATLAACADPPLPVRVRGGESPGLQQDRYVPSVQRAKSELQVEEWTELGVGLRRTLEWYRLGSAHTRETA